MDETELRDWECMVTNEDLDCVLNYYDWGTINEDVNEMLHDRRDLWEAITVYIGRMWIVYSKLSGKEKQKRSCTVKT